MFKYTLLTTITLLTLTACGGGGGSDQPQSGDGGNEPAATPLVGAWIAQGTYLSGESSTTAIAIMPDGRVYGYEDTGNLIIGTISPTATAIDQNFRVHDAYDGTYAHSIRLQMAPQMGSLYQGTTWYGSDQLADFSAVPYGNTPADNSLLSGNWLTSSETGSYVINGSGQVSGYDHYSGCELSGQVYAIADSNLYDINLRLSGCYLSEDNGDYRGGGFLWANVENYRAFIGVIANDRRAFPIELIRQ